MTNSASSDHLQHLRDRAGHELASALDRIPFRRAHVLILVLVAVGTLVNAIEEYDVGLAAPLIASQWSLSNAQVGLLTTVTFAGMAIGSLIAGVTGDRYGRRITMMYTLALYTVGALAAAFSPNFVWLLVARFVVGIGLGGELSTGITLVAELMPTKFRGAAVATVNVAGGGLGIFASSALGALMLGPLQETLGGPTVAWRWLLGVLAVPALLVLAYRWFLPESPRFLLVDGQVDEANKVLTRLAANRLRPLPGMPTTRYIDAVEGARLPRQRVRLKEVFQGRLARNTVVIWVVAAMTFGAQVTVTVFMPTVLVSRGLDVSTSLVYTMIINVGGLVGAVLASIFGYWFKRRVVLGYGSAVAVVVAIVFATSPMVLVFGGLLQLMFILLNTTTFIWATELYPTRIRAFGTGAMVTVLLLSASLVPLLAGVIVDAAGTVGLFVLVGAMYVIMAVAVGFGPETQGRSLEE
ncbi:MFS transporter [Pseudonocardia xinjiangensis]|uniref:MFS transporter n=1 Tax=Pseudonocardia xinjiangensis TaxID=75289 RepID=A0ABX1RS12_9PSEU|nr:MFS transporter [Pseudonocardia xinjiangensis]NMH81971.1 MFS transporter [Pseudonocardia xinjiangensis]